MQTSELSKSVESLYAVFEGYRLRPDTQPCLCCHSSEDDRKLRSKLLRKLGPKDLYGYASDALYTWGDETDFKHFLPRILELFTLADTPGHEFVDPESVFSRLTYESCGSSSWRTWPTDEQTAISAYNRAVWQAVLNTAPEELSDGAYQWLCAFAGAGQDLSAYLDYWMKATSVNAHRNLSQLILWEGVPNIPKPVGGYWKDRKEEWQQLVGWLRRPDVKQKLAIALEQWSHLPFSNELFDAAVMLP